MSTRLLLRSTLVVGLALVPLSGSAQNTNGTARELGSESANWGLAPFVTLPALPLRAEDRLAVRSLEDQHLKERRQFEDKYETELRALIRKQAEEREALRTRLSAPH